jgi:hypothetical protein
MGRGSGTGEIVDLIDLDLERVDHVVPQEFKPRIGQQMDDVLLPAGKQIVEADDLMAVADQAIAEVAAEKSGAAGH